MKWDPGITFRAQFVSKAERERRKQEEEKQKAEAKAANTSSSKASSRSNPSKSVDSKRASERASSRSDADRARDKKREYKYSEKEQEEMLITSKEIDMIRSTRLGINKERKSVNKPSEKFKKIYVDDWNPDDDTSKDINPLYQNKYQGKILFGKGMLAGIDEEEQKVDISKKKGYEADTRDAAISWQDKPASEMTPRDWMILREDNNIIVQGKRVPLPFIRWKELNVDKKILEAISEIGYEKPSPIQMQAIPIVLDKRDLVGIAPTGMGKSCAFLVPMIQFFLNLPKISGESIADGPYGLILTPTRELSIQIEAELNRLSKYTHLRTAWLIGGRSASEQSSKISRGWEVIIGTPGRILDCLNKRLLVLNQCFYLILDEADKMIEMDLVEDVTKILSFIEEHALETILSHLEPEARTEFVSKLNGRKRIINLFSATISQDIRKLAKDLLSEHVFVSIDEPGSGNKRITQEIEFVKQSHKTVRTIELLEEIGPPCLVFVNHKADTERLSNEIDKRGWKSAAMHGGKTQERREASLLQFKKWIIDVLVCTNVLARGIDIDNVKQVINYDCPNVFHDYVHRIGRTGRAGKTGIATTFVGAENAEIFPELKKFLEQNGQRVPRELNEYCPDVGENIKF